MHTPLNILNILCWIQEALQRIWQTQPSYTIKARIDDYSVHHGSFHTLKSGHFINDEVT